jgi:hypothetical protein
MLLLLWVGEQMQLEAEPGFLQDEPTHRWPSDAPRACYLQRMLRRVSSSLLHVEVASAQVRSWRMDVGRSGEQSAQRR